MSKQRSLSPRIDLNKPHPLKPGGQPPRWLRRRQPLFAEPNIGTKRRAMPLQTVVRKAGTAMADIKATPKVTQSVAWWQVLARWLRLHLLRKEGRA